MIHTRVQARSNERVMRRASGETFWCDVTGRALKRSAPRESGIWSFMDRSLGGPFKPELTAREREVATYLMDGMTSKQVASTTADLVLKLMGGQGGPST